MSKQEGGFVYVQTNDADHNEVVVFARGAHGELERRGSHLTGGKGSGAPHLPSQSSVVLEGDRLFVTNAGSDVSAVARRMNSGPANSSKGFVVEAKAGPTPR